MMVQNGLHNYIIRAAQTYPDQVAIIGVSGHQITYKEMGDLTEQLRDRLQYIGVLPGDRVGIYLHKSIDSVASIFGILKAGGTYVPVDPGAPASRNAYILNDCSVKVVIVEDIFVEDLKSEIQQIGKAPEFIILQGIGGGSSLRAALDRWHLENPAPSGKTIDPSLDDLAYILYTSGSTGKPKGVMLSHRNATSFIDWCSEVFDPKDEDRFSSHAPFHFDLSILDIYVPLKHGASLVLISEEIGKDPQRLAQLISDQKITVWYSTPSILTLLTQYGKLESYDYSSLRHVLFAGEVFPVKHLRRLKEHITHPRYFNLYGPTETNVCTYYEIPHTIPDEQSKPFPIGKACSHLMTKVVNESGLKVHLGVEGELVVAGPGVMRGYWNLPEHNRRAFIEDANGEKWYKTGDIVIESSDGNYIYLGRRDRMVKKRGYRVELGEIESALYRHPAVREAAVIADTDQDGGIRIKAFLNCKPGERPSIIKFKGFCMQHLPNYMIPDVFCFKDSLPKTSTDKIDYQSLKKLDC